MIIKYPTALLKNIIPGPMDAGSISYTISNNDPPKSNQVFLQLPPEEEYRPSNPLIIPRNQRRKFLGDLFSEMSIPGSSDKATGDIQFEIGQTLEFINSTNPDVDPYVLESVDLIQNNGVVDYSKFGLTPDEITEIKTAAQKEYDSIILEISNTGNKINVNLSQIQSNQADINSLTRLYNSTSKVLGVGNLSAIKLKTKLETLKLLNDSLSQQNTEFNDVLAELRNNLEIVREVIR